MAALAAEDGDRGRVDPHEDLAHRLGQALARPHDEGHAGPAPGVDVQPHRGEGLDRRVLGHAGLVAVAAELAAHDVGLAQRGHGADAARPCASRMASGSLAGRRLHRQQRDDLEHVVLDHVADRAGLVVERAAALDAEALGHRDLDAGDVVAVPDRLEEARWRSGRRGGSGPAPCPGSGRCGRSRPRGRPRAASRLSAWAEARSCPNGFSTTMRAPLGAQPESLSACGHGAEQRRRDREVVQGAARAAELLAQARERVRVGVVAVHVAQELRQLREGAAVEPRRAPRGCPAPAS